MNCFAWAFHACHASNDVASSGLQASSPVFEEVEENSPFPGHSFARIKLGGHSWHVSNLAGILRNCEQIIFGLQLRITVSLRFSIALPISI